MGAESSICSFACCKRVPEKKDASRIATHPSVGSTNSDEQMRRGLPYNHIVPEPVYGNFAAESPNSVTSTSPMSIKAGLPTKPWFDQPSFCTKEAVHETRRLRKGIQSHETDFQRICEELRQLVAEEVAYKRRISNNAHAQNMRKEKELAHRRHHLSIEREKLGRILQIEHNSLTTTKSQTLTGGSRPAGPAYFRSHNRRASASPEPDADRVRGPLPLP